MTQRPETTSAKGWKRFIYADILITILLLVAFIGLFSFFEDGEAPFVENVSINISLSSLPYYSILSLTRSFLALAVSYSFAILYGKMAARKNFDTIMVPLLDVLQSLPVLAFLPGFVLTLLSIFRGSRWGLELACILMIFTGQAWNLAFAFYESQKSLPAELKELAQIEQFTKLEKLFLIELPHGITPLVYNGMISMAGGWFFLTLCEAFVLGGKSYTLPGLGSYLALSAKNGQYLPFCAGIGALALMIVLVDLIIWRPLLSWANSFRDSADAESSSKSWFLSIIKRSYFYEIGTALIQKIKNRPDKKKNTSAATTSIFRLLRNIRSFPNMTTLFAYILRHRFFVGMTIGFLIFLALPWLPRVARMAALIDHHTWDDALLDLWYTFSRVLGVLALSSLWTIPFGFLVGRNRKIASRVLPILQNVAAFPAPVFFPLVAMLLLKVSLPAWLIALLLMTLGNQWYLLFNVVSSVARIPNDLVLMGKAFQFSKMQMIFRVYLPSMLPSLITGWITCAGGAWNASIVAELIEFAGGKVECRGIGADIALSTTTGDYPRLFASIVVIVIALVSLNRTVWHQLHKVAEHMKA